MKIQSSTVLLTGATGFLGSHLAKSLQSNCHHLVILKRKSSATDRISSILSASNVSICNVEDGLENIFSKHNVDAVVHCAVEYGRNEISCLKTLSTNLIFPVSLIELAIKSKVKTFINTDSYFNKPTFSYKHLLNYSLSKKSFLFWLDHFSKDIQTVNVILEHIYGENDSSDKFVESAIQKIAIEKKSSYEVTPGEQRRDFIYVSDAVSAYTTILAHALQTQDRQLSYNLGCGAAMTIRDFLKTIQQVSSSKTELVFGAKPYRDDEIMLSVADNANLKSLGWQPHVSAAEGIQRIISQYQKK